MPDAQILGSPVELDLQIAKLIGPDEASSLDAETKLVSWGSAATSVLEDALARAPFAVRPRILRVLCSRGGDTCLAALHNSTLLARHLRSVEAVEFQIALIQSIQTFGAGSSVHAYLRMLTVEHGSVQQQALRGLVSCGRGAVPGLLTALGSSSESVRVGAAAALGEIGDISALEGLKSALTDSRDSFGLLAIEAALALGRIAERHPSARLKTLLPLLRSQTNAWGWNEEVQLACRWSLARVTAAVRTVERSPIPAHGPRHAVQDLPIPSGGRLRET